MTIIRAKDTRQVTGDNTILTASVSDNNSQVSAEYEYIDIDII